MKWFTSDTHFGHANILKYCNRPFSSVEHMNEVMIHNWNSVVSPDDDVYHMGDVALGKIAESLPLVGLLNGRKHLLIGNHDRISSVESEKRRERFLPAYEEVFQDIMGEVNTTYLMTDAGSQWFVMSHYPYQGDHTEHDRHVELRPVDEGLPLIHGHIHNMRRIDGRMFNVGVDVNSFTPVHEDVIMEWALSLRD